MDLTNHTIAELKKIAQTHQLAYYSHLNKSQLQLYIQLTFSQIYKTCCICLNDELHTIKCTRCSCITCPQCDEQIKLCPLCRLPNPNKLTNLTVLFVDETRQKKVVLTKEIYDIIKKRSSLESFKNLEDLIIQNINSTKTGIMIDCWLLD